MIKFKNVHAETNRHGQTVYYYRAAGGRRVRLPAPHETSDFGEAVRLAATLKIGRATRPADNEQIRTRRQIGNSIKAGLARAKQRAKIKGLPLDIDEPWVIQVVESQNLRCAVTGIPFYFGPVVSHRDPFAPSLDRIDSKRGYTRDNVRVVLYSLNVMLSDWGADVFEKVALGYRANKNKTSNSIPAPRGINPRTLKKV